MLDIIYELASVCNLQCKMCGWRHGHRRECINIDDFIASLDDIRTSRALISNVTLHGNGEPLLHPDIVRAVAETRKRFDRVSILTNATLLTEDLSRALIGAGLSNLSFSVTGITPEVYKEFQGANMSAAACANLLEKVKTNIASFARIRNELNAATTLQLRYILTDLSYGVFFESMNFWRRLGVDMMVYTPLLVPLPPGNAGAKDGGETVVSDHPSDPKNIVIRKECDLFLKRTLINVRGEIFPCCAGSARVVGFMRDGFSAYLHSKQMREIKQAFDSASTIGMLPDFCRTCDYFIKNCQTIKLGI